MGRRRRRAGFTKMHTVTERVGSSGDNAHRRELTYYKALELQDEVKAKLEYERQQDLIEAKRYRNMR